MHLKVVFITKLISVYFASQYQLIRASTFRFQCKIYGTDLPVQRFRSAAYVIHSRAMIATCYSLLNRSVS